MAFCKSEEFTFAKVGNSFCNFVLFHYATNIFATVWGLETVFSLKGLKWKLAVSAIFLGLSFGFAGGHSLIMEIGFVERYAILPFTSVWILTLWIVSRQKQ